MVYNYYDNYLDYYDCIVEVSRELVEIAGGVSMTIEETRNYLRSYKNMLNRVEYIDNKLINVKSIHYDSSPVGSYSEPKTKIDYIQMKDQYLKEMQDIRQSIESLNNMTYRDVLFYKYIELMNVYDIGELMEYSPGTVRRYLTEATQELSKSIIVK